MERLIQLLDDLDDLVGVLGLLGERLRNSILALLIFVLFLGVQIGGILLALRHPPLASATAILMFIMLLYRKVTASHQQPVLAGDINTP